MNMTDKMRLGGIAAAFHISALLLVAATPCASQASVSAVSSNAISLDTRDWSKVTVASNGALPSFSSTQTETIIIFR